MRLRNFSFARLTRQVQLSLFTAYVAVIAGLCILAGTGILAALLIGTACALLLSGIIASVEWLRREADLSQGGRAIMVVVIAVATAIGGLLLLIPLTIALVGLLVMILRGLILLI